MITALAFFLVLAAVAVVVYVVGLYSRTKIKLSQVTSERDKLRSALSISRGYLYSMSTSDIPGVSDGATRALDAVDQSL